MTDAEHVAALEAAFETLQSAIGAAHADGITVELDVVRCWEVGLKHGRLQITPTYFRALKP